MIGEELDFLENLEYAAEEAYWDMLQPDGKSLKCGCGKVFDPDKEGGTPSPNPYAMPVCGDCLYSFIEGEKIYE